MAVTTTLKISPNHNKTAHGSYGWIFFELENTMKKLCRTYSTGSTKGNLPVINNTYKIIKYKKAGVFLNYRECLFRFLSSSCITGWSSLPPLNALTLSRTSSITFGRRGCPVSASPRLILRTFSTMCPMFVTPTV